jgi:CheY-like chemotaxis protein
LLGDEFRIRQALNNVLTNVFKYTADGKVTLSAACEQGLADNEIMFIFGVQDSESEGQAANLFDECSQIGFAVTQHLVKLMNGDIHVENKSGIGTLFTVRLPQGRVDSEVLGGELAASLQQLRMNGIQKKRQIAHEPMPYGKVLIVDDMESNLYVAEGLMKPYKLQIDTADSGYAAIDKIKEGNEYDIVFMDHMMSGMDGMETAKHLRELGYTSAIVALTANAVAGQAEKYLQNGFDDFIFKPVDTRRLNFILNKLVRDKQPPEVIEAARQSAVDLQKPSFKPADIFGFDVEIAGLDISKGFTRFFNNPEIYIKILRSYTKSIRSVIDLTQTINEETLTEYQRAVHSIKGASLEIFAEPVGNKAGELEKAAKTKNIDYIEKETPAFTENAMKLVTDIENVLCAVDEKTTRAKKDKIDGELLVKLLGYCENYDMDGVDAVMAEIDKFQYEADAALFAYLRENVDMVNFDGIAERLTKM